jgi:hypothetical protein
MIIKFYSLIKKQLSHIMVDKIVVGTLRQNRKSRKGSIDLDKNSIQKTVTWKIMPSGLELLHQN